MIVATFSIHDQSPRILATVNSPCRWLVKLWTADGKDRDTREIRNKQPCRLTDLLPTAIDEIESMLEERTQYTAAGFQVIRLR